MSEEHSEPRELQDDELELLPEETDSDTDAGDGLEIDASQTEEIRRIFGTTLPQYLEPVEEMLEQILTGKPSPDTVSALAGTLVSLSQAASRVGFDEVVQQLDRFHDRVTALGERKRAASRGDRETILGALFDLKDMAQRLSGGDAGTSERSPTIFQALRGAEDIGEDVLQKLSAAGLTRVEQLRQARPDEVAAVTGLDAGAVQRLLDRVLALDDTAPGATEGGARVEQLPLGADALEKVLERKLGEQVEAEAALEEARDRIQRLRAGVKRARRRLKELSQRSRDLDAERADVARQRAHRAEALSEARQARDALELRYARQADALREHNEQLLELRRRRQQLSRHDATLDEEVEQLVSRVRGLLDRVNERGRRLDGTQKR
jgi:uncharacterized coiled-coil protein SlyX